MAREKEAFRDNLQRLKEAFPNKEILNASEVARWAGMSRETVIKHYGIEKNKGISVATLARKLS